MYFSIQETLSKRIRNCWFFSKLHIFLHNPKLLDFSNFLYSHNVLSGNWSGTVNFKFDSNVDENRNRYSAYGISLQRIIGCNWAKIGSRHRGMQQINEFAVLPNCQLTRLLLCEMWMWMNRPCRMNESTTCFFLVVFCSFTHYFFVQFVYCDFCWHAEHSKMKISHVAI